MRFYFHSSSSDPLIRYKRYNAGAYWQFLIFSMCYKPSFVTDRKSAKYPRRYSFVMLVTDEVARQNTSSGGPSGCFDDSSKLDACGHVEFVDGLGMVLADSVQKWLKAEKVLRVPICRKMLHHSNTLDALEAQ